MFWPKKVKLLFFLRKPGSKLQLGGFEVPSKASKEQRVLGDWSLGCDKAKCLVRDEMNTINKQVLEHARGSIYVAELRVGGYPAHGNG